MVNGIKRVEIITTVLVTNATGNSMHNLGPAFDRRTAQFQAYHGQHFSLKHTYLLDANITNCSDLASQTSRMIAEWYYKKRINAEVIPCLTPAN
ncbi:hypothetical protein RvY_16636 [Ramazzottius varieornatus]|uniref:Uncharacterized protein n=1 Tax=Ramazzottius varieornatus TaxID=947166 RepID=A0A1D1VZ80_RAMVA|nr:hypothetical protein RvY_16636 [Ramazzottius varieornatus]